MSDRIGLRPMFWAALLVFIVLFSVSPARAAVGPVESTDPDRVVERLSAAVRSGNTADIAPWLTADGQADVTALVTSETASGTLGRLGSPLAYKLVRRTEQADGTEIAVDVTYSGGIAHWTFTFDDRTSRLSKVSLVAVPTGPAPPGPPKATANEPQEAAVVHHEHSRHHSAFHGGRPPASQADGSPEPAQPPSPPPPPPPSPEPPTASQASADISSPESAPSLEPAAAAPITDPRTVEFMLATTRMADTTAGIHYTAARSDQLAFGLVRVHVPIDHKPGHVERPTQVSLLGFTLYEQKLDEKKHFVVTGLRTLGPDDFYRFATSDPHKEALIFVHGFNNTFEASAYRFAQILYDLQYDRPAILFSWASRGSVVDYVYDKESAEMARDRFAQLVRSLHQKGVEKINVIAHSMGNYLAVAALADSAETADPDRVNQLIMAAPDIGRDYFALEAPKLLKIAHGITLYACATDRALELSKGVAGGIPRAGDVPSDGPVQISGIDTIDVTALGGDWFGLNHDVFADNRSVMDDIFSLLKDEKPPPRLAQVRGMPDGAVPPKFWRYVP